MKIAKLFWIVGSILINITIGIYISLMVKAPSPMKERFQYINENWEIFSAHWKAEFILMALIAISALYFANYFKSFSWTIITIGQISLLLTYPLMLGGYYDTTFENFLMINNIATNVFLFGNVFFLGGLLLLYIKNNSLPHWLRIIAIGLASITTIAVVTAFIGIFTWNQIMMVGPLINALYLINAYYIFQLEVESES